MSDNLKIYNSVRSVPKEALKSIQAGRLKGKSDISPMWRIKTLTEQFGPCGIGWKYEIVRQWLETGPVKNDAKTDEIAAFVQINLYIKVDGAWSEAIPGVGGSSFLTIEKTGPYLSDECYKMALTDALSVSCKALGVAADVYWGEDSTKYGKKPEAQPESGGNPPICPRCGKPVRNATRNGVSVSGADVLRDLGICLDCHKAALASHG